MRPNDTRKCPFCGKTIILGDCSVISAIEPESFSLSTARLLPIQESGS